MHGWFELKSLNEMSPYFFLSRRVVNVASRLGMLENIKNNQIRQNFISSTATIETVSDVLSDFIK